MGLSPDQEKVWQEQMREIEDLQVDFEPLHIPLKRDDTLEKTVDLRDVVINAQARRKLSDTNVSRATEFMDYLFLSANASPIIAKLPIIETESGREVILRFPKSEEATQ